MPDAFFYTLEKVGIYGEIAVLSTGILLWLIYKITLGKVSSICTVTNKLDETVDLVRKAIVKKDGEICSLEEHQRLLDNILQHIFDIETNSFNLLKKHVEDIERACNEERYIACDINRCKHFGQIVNFVEQMREHLRIFVSEGRDARNMTCHI